MATFKLKRLVYMGLTGHRGLMKTHHRDINRYSQWESAARVVHVMYINGVMGTVATFCVNL
jgi:hypothetical protein